MFCSLACFFADIKFVFTCLFTYYILIQVIRPVPFPCFGVLKKEKHVLLPSVADIVIEQGKGISKN